MVHHEVVPVLVLPLFDLVDLHLHAKLQLFLEFAEFDLVAVDEVFLLQLKLLHEMLDGVLELLLLLFSFGNIINVFTRVFVLLLSLALTVLIFLS